MPRITIDQLRLELPRNADAATIERAVGRALAGDARLAGARADRVGATVARSVAARVRAELSARRR